MNVNANLRPEVGNTEGVAKLAFLPKCTVGVAELGKIALMYGRDPIGSNHTQRAQNFAPLHYADFHPAHYADSQRLVGAQYIAPAVTQRGEQKWGATLTHHALDMD